MSDNERTFCKDLDSVGRPILYELVDGRPTVIERQDYLDLLAKFYAGTGEVTKLTLISNC